MSIQESIPERDLPVVSAGPADFVRVVQGGKTALSLAAGMPVPIAISQDIAAVKQEQANTDARVSAVESGQDGLSARMQGAESGITQNTSKIETLEASQGSGMAGYATKANLPATGTANALAVVTNDPTPANNGTYRWNGSAWEISADRTTQIAADVAAVKVTGQLMLNRGANFPLKPMTRSGTNSAAQSYFNNSILAARVVNARSGKYYRISFFKNGAALGGPQDGWIIEEHDAATYATASSPLLVLHYTNPAPDIPRDGGVHTVRLISSVVAGMEFYITVDTSQLPAIGNSIDANSGNTRPAWSWIIEPTNYDLVQSTYSGGGLSASGVHVSGDRTSSEFRVVIPMGRTNMARFTCKPNGKNGLFNIRKLEVAVSGDPTTAAWSVMSDTDTDWLPPLKINALANNDGSATGYYTGGNHGSDGSSGGTATASMTVFAMDIEGRAIGAGEAVNGYARAVTFRWANDVQAYNTVSLGRAVVRQWFTMQFTEHGVECLCTVEALEACIVEQDNGLQVVGNGFEASCHYYDGEAKARQLAAAVTHSGMKNIAPDAWAMSLSGPNGLFNCWMDRSYGLGNGSNVYPQDAYMRKNSTIWKFYHAVISRPDAGLSMSAGQTYDWRGGYSLAPESMTAGTGIDSGFVFSKGGRPHLAWAFTAAGTGEVRPPVLYAGRVVGSAVIGATGLRVSAGAYLTQKNELS